MMGTLSEALKRKRDAEARRMRNEPVTVFVDGGSGVPEPSIKQSVTKLNGLSGEVTLVAGSEIDVSVLGNVITITNTKPDHVDPTIIKGVSFYFDDVLEVGDVITIIAPEDLTIKETTMIVSTAPSNGDLVVDIRINGSSVYTASPAPTIIDGTTSVNGIIPDVSTVLKGDAISAVVTATGSTVAGANLSVSVVCEVV